MIYTYPPAYIRACSHLIEHGSWEGDRATGRLLIAQALRWIRGKDKDWARRERCHLRQISGQFPVKDTEIPASATPRRYPGVKGRPGIQRRDR